MGKKDIEVSTSYVEPQKFNDPSHVYSFINYLLRTDKNQKWTNQDSIKNIAIIDSDCIFLTNETNKQKAKNKILEKIRPIMKQNYKKLENNILYFELSIGGEPIQLLKQENIEEVFAYLVDYLKEQTEECYLLSVIHLDQNETEHIHSIILKKGVRENDR